jgi:hypothetical protein
MQLKTISIEDLIINPKNDRHGELPSERDAMAWLFHEREAHMRNLAKDIAEKGEIFEPPLIRYDNRRRRYIVFDGNRRVSCLKLLLKPDQAPTVELRQFFEAQFAAAPDGIPSRIACEVEDDFDRIDEILFRRHTGAQNGVGRSPWDDTAKQNFLKRSGKQVGINVPEAIEHVLLQAKHLDTEGHLPRSTLKRLLSSEEFRNRVGVSLSKGRITFTHKEKKVLDVLAHIADDLMNQRLVLGDL